MKGLPHGSRPEYAWPQAQEELEDGIHPEVVAARLGEPVSYVLEVADQQGWAVTWKGPTAEQVLDAYERSDA